jgi:hypothetical protein
VAGFDPGCDPPTDDLVEVPDIMRALEPEVVDAVLAAVEPLLPSSDRSYPLGCHRPRVADRLCFRGILIRLVTVSDAGLLADIGTLHLDRGYDSGAVRDRLRHHGIDQFEIRRRGTKLPGIKNQPLPLGLRWIVEATNTWWSNDGQLRRNTDRQPRTATPPSAWPLPFSSSVASSTGGTAGARTDAYPRTSFDLQFEWGPNGLEQLGPGAAGIVIVDVLRFTTAVSVAIGRGATVLPYRWADNGAETYAAQHNALLAGAGPEGAHWSLSPIDLSRLQPGTLLVLVSPNGSALACGAGGHAPHAQVWRAACATPRRWRARRLRRCPPSCRGHRRR